MRYSTMVRVTLESSRWLTIVLTTVHAGSVALLIPLGLPLWMKLALAAAIAVGLAHSLRRHALRRSASAFTGIELRDEDRAAVRTRDGKWHDARILPTTYVSPVLTIINLKLAQQSRPRHAVIVPDSVRADDFRALRVSLRWRYRRSG
ncbi:MAG TPA: protein YgfX [Burkholderiales bacterium]|nr:protein YgfX [Burkholderiales bacterium]